MTKKKEFYDNICTLLFELNLNQKKKKNPLSRPTEKYIQVLPKMKKVRIQLYLHLRISH